MSILRTGILRTGIPRIYITRIYILILYINICTPGQGETQMKLCRNYETQKKLGLLSGILILIPSLSY